MTKLFGAVVGFLSFFKTRPADKAKVIEKQIKGDKKSKKQSKGD